MSNPNYGTQGYGLGGYGNEPLESLPIGYYQALLTSQYANSPKLNALLKMLLKKFDDVSQCLVKMNTALDLDSAVGAQLDAKGTVAQAGRVLPFQPSFGVSPVLDDITYRIYIKAKIAQNQWDGTIGSLYTIWAYLFPTTRIVIADNQNMTATLFIGGLSSSLLIDMICGFAVNGVTTGIVQNGLIVPRPEGVEYLFNMGKLPAFGFDLNDAFVAGFDVGYWSGASTTPGLLNQTITFVPLTSPVVNGASPITLSATASSGLSVVFSVISGPGTVAGNVLTITGVGTVVIAANQAGNGSYNSALQVVNSVVVTSAIQYDTPNLQTLSTWGLHISGSGAPPVTTPPTTFAAIGGVPPAVYSFTQGTYPATAATLSCSGSTVPGGYADWMAYLPPRPILTNTGNLQLSFTLTVDAACATYAQAIEIDTILSEAGYNYNGSCQLNYAEGGRFQIVNAAQSWIDCGFNPGLLTPGIAHAVVFTYKFDTTTRLFSFASIQLDGVLFTIPTGMQNVPAYVAGWAPGPCLQVQQDLNAAAGHMSFTIDNVQYAWW
jgi:hypothetical protein